ncbi:MAG: ECF-type sigma factor [Pseudomonadota bacterium]|nr:ECF-type sigma factor [Pseudomonadota bacterium]
MGDVTKLLQEARSGNSQALAELFETLYPELRRIARRRLARDDGDSIDASTSSPMKTMQRRLALHALTMPMAAALAPTAFAQAMQKPRERKPDLGDVAEGRYAGDVISDSKGSSRQGVTLTLTRVGVNRVRIDSDYPRLPVVEVTLTRALDKIVQTRGNTAFVYDPAKKPTRLDVSFNNEVSWSGSKQ